MTFICKADDRIHWLHFSSAINLMLDLLFMTPAIFSISGTHPPKARIPFWGVFYAFLGVMVLAVLVFNIARPIVVLPRITVSPGYRMTSADGGRATSEDQRGKFTLYSFSYTNCLTFRDCGQSWEQINALYQDLSHNPELANLAVPFEFITLSLAGDWDTQTWQANSNQFLWRQFNLAPEALKPVVTDGFGLYYQTESAGVKFQSRYVLVDGLGTIRAYYDNTPSAQKIARDLLLLDKEIRQATGALKLAYEAAHLFACYPR
jgi:protein SCO1/2